MNQVKTMFACLAIAAALVLAGTLDAQDQQQHRDAFVPPYIAKLNAP